MLWKELTVHPAFIPAVVTAVVALLGVIAAGLVGWRFKIESDTKREEANNRLRDDLMVVIDGLKAQVRELLIQNADQQKQINELRKAGEADRHALESEITTLRHALKESNAKCEELGQQVEAMQKQLAEEKELRHAIRNELQKTQSERDEAKIKQEQAERDLAAHKLAPPIGASTAPKPKRR